MARILVVIERAYTGCVEEQYAHILWMCHSYNKAGGNVAVLLQGNAVCYGRADQVPAHLSVGGTLLTYLNDYGSSVKDLVADGTGVYALRSDLERLQIEARELVQGVTVIDYSDLGRIVASADTVCYW